MENCRQIMNEVCTCGCQETGKFRESESERSRFESLKKYEVELRIELTAVRQRLKELETIE